MFDGPAPAGTRTRARVLHVDDVPTPELGPGEALVAVMASAINYNTVWTSIFEPVLDLHLPASATAGCRRWPSATTCPTTCVGSDLSGVVLRTGPGRARLEARRRGRRALPVGRAGEPGRPQRHDARPRAADLGLRDQLRRPGRARPGQVQPADAQAGAPDLGGGRQPRAGQLHRLPAARLAQRRRHEAGRHRAHLGRRPAASALRHPVRAQRRRDPGLRRVQPGEGRRSAARWAPS